MSDEIIQDGNAEFHAIGSSDLEPVAVVAQSLDNQWVPSDLIRQMLRRRHSLEDVSRKRDRYVRSEYLRALVNAKQLVVNRAFLYNNPAMSRDYVDKDKESYDTFKAFLDTAVLVPFLFGERLPHQRPRFSTDPTGFQAWERICQESRPYCLRLSWNDDQNLEYIREQLVRRFGDFAQNVNRLDPKVLARDTGLAPAEEAPLRKRLTEVSHRCVDWSGEGKDITRENLYREFVIADGTDPAEGKYDKGKPFVAEIKQLLDLDYNVNLPDALQRYPLTPMDSLNRTSLQEWQMRAKESREITVEELVTLLRQAAFELVQEGLYIKSLGTLSLGDIRRVRKTGEWSQYIASMEALMDEPMEFSDPDRGAAAVYKSYVQLARVSTEIAKHGKIRLQTERWTPVAEFVVEVAGAALSVILADPPIYKILGTISGKIGTRAAPMVVRLVVRGLNERGSRADLATSADFMKGHFERVDQQWEELVRAFQKLPGFEEARGDVARARQSNIDYAEDLYV
jgi:hypothetical protein